MPPSVAFSFAQATAALQNNNFLDAERHFKDVLRREPKHIGALNLLSVLLTRLERYAEAERYIKSAAKLRPDSDATQYNYGLILKALKRPGEALERFTRAISINAAVAETWNNRGTVLNDLGRYDDAVADYHRALELQPNYPGAICNLGKSLTELNRYDEALAAYQEALAYKADLVEAWLGRGWVFCQLKRHDDALAAYDTVLSQRPQLAEAWLGRSRVFYDLNRYDEALASFDAALAADPGLAEAWLGRGNVFYELSRRDEALAAYDKALSLKPDLAGAWLGRGNVLLDFKRHNDALAAYEKALSHDPELAQAWLNRGNLYSVIKSFAKAIASYDRALKINPDVKYAEGSRLHAKQMLCDWSDLDAETEHLLAVIRQGKPASVPFPLLSIASTPADQLQCAQMHIGTKYTARPLIWRGERYAHDRIRIAYLSADLRQHPVADLTAGLFERHDRSRFEITAIALGPDEDSLMRGRLKWSFDRFISAEAQSDREIAELIRRLEIDILVDLGGFTDGARPGILAQRPAPIQVNYLGYAGTMGADYFDYILADPVIIPEDQFAFYSERVVWLADSFMVGDDKRQISEHTPTRQECGLPETGFVFCCFNNTFKIAPDIFDIWMRLLRASEGSVLWLSEGNSAAAANLRREAEKRGVAAQRLVFAARAPAIGDHLARHRLADLFLDTLPYNAHATASDALWAGLPILTCPGSTFAGRVGASLLGAIGLDELVTASLADYEAMALALAQDPVRMRALRDKLARNRATQPLFDTARFTRHIEQAYITMWERRHRGEPPAPYAVAAMTNPK
jgi:predicted O-linked N-acetylglucosamine transferase (SPINDLY family)